MDNRPPQFSLRALLFVVSAACAVLTVGRLLNPRIETILYLLSIATLMLWWVAKTSRPSMPCAMIGTGCGMGIGVVVFGNEGASLLCAIAGSFVGVALGAFMATAPRHNRPIPRATVSQSPGAGTR